MGFSHVPSRELVNVLGKNFASRSTCGATAGCYRTHRKLEFYRQTFGMPPQGRDQRSAITLSATNLKNNQQTLAELEQTIGRQSQPDRKHDDNLDYLEELCTSNVAMNPWNELFRNLAKNEEFIHEYWSKKPFKFDAVIPFAKECFTMSDLETQCTFYPATYAGTAVLTLENGGWMMSKFGPEMNDVNNMAPLDFDSIKQQMQKGTVSLNSAGLCSSLLRRAASDGGCTGPLLQQTKLWYPARPRTASLL
eukprot:767862-Hanusia_phi.AAC.1